MSFSIWIWTASICVDPFQINIWSHTLIGVILYLCFFNYTVSFVVSVSACHLSVPLTLKTLRFGHWNVVSPRQIRNSSVGPRSHHSVVPRSLRLRVHEISSSPICGLASLLVVCRVLRRLLLDIGVFKNSVLVLQSFVRVERWCCIDANSDVQL